MIKNQLYQKAPIETDFVKVWIDEGIVHTAYPKDFKMTLDKARAIVELRKEYTEGIAYPGLADIRNLKKVDFAAMKFLASSAAYAGVIRAAVYSNNKLGRILINFWLSVDKPVTPTKYFTDIGAAKLYLKEISAN